MAGKGEAGAPGEVQSSAGCDDADGHERSYRYEDATGLVVEWQASEHSALGYYGRFDGETYQDDELVEQETYTLRFDEIGRIKRERHDILAWEDGEIWGALGRVERTTWDCPGR